MRARALFLLGAALIAGSACSDSSPRPARHLLLVTLDTTRADHLGLYGYARPTSPALDRLAQRGQRFDAAQTVMTTTLPAHAALFTSQHPRRLGVRANGVPVPEEAHTLAERLAARGFATGAFVSAAPLSSKLGIQQGFAVYDEPLGDERTADRTRERAVAWLSEHAARASTGERLFAFVHFFDAHVWYTPPAEWRELLGVPGGVQPYARGVVPDRAALTPERLADGIAAYDAEIRFVDEELGKLAAALEELRLAEDTLVVVLADHGETLDELLQPYGYVFDHGEFLHRRELRVPLVIVPPAASGFPSPVAHADVVTTLDLMPTVLELLDVPCEAPFDGRSLVPLLSGSALPPAPAFAERRRLTSGEQQRPPVPELAGPELAVTTAEWLYVSSEGRGNELFGLGRDPEAQRDVSAEEPQVAAELDDLLRALDAHFPVGESTGTESLDPELDRALRSLGYTTEGLPQADDARAEGGGERE